MEIVRSALFNRRLTPRPIGQAELVCTFTSGNSRVCRGTFYLPKGKIVVGGSIEFRSSTSSPCSAAPGSTTTRGAR